MGSPGLSFSSDPVQVQFATEPVPSGCLFWSRVQRVYLLLQLHICTWWKLGHVWKKRVPGRKAAVDQEVLDQEVQFQQTGGESVKYPWHEFHRQDRCRWFPVFMFVLSGDVLITGVHGSDQVSEPSVCCSEIIKYSSGFISDSSSSWPTFTVG